MFDPSAYEWLAITECNMCGASLATARALGRRLGEHQGLRPAGRAGAQTPFAMVQRCGNCGLVFANPMPLPRDIASHYGIPAEVFWEQGDLILEEGYFADQILQFHRLYSRAGPLTALDIGAGVGKAMRSLEAAGFVTFGLEPSREFHEFAVTRTGIAPERLTLGRIEHAVFDPDRFDLVTFGAVLEHLADPAAAIERALGWVRAGGLIHIEVPSADWLMARLIDFGYRIQRLSYTSHLSPFHIPFHLFEFTMKSFAHHAVRTGYEIALSRRHVAQSFAPRWADGVLAPLMRASGTGLQLEVWLRKPDLFRALKWQ